MSTLSNETIQTAAKLCEKIGLLTQVREDFRANMGTKSKWSSHQKIQEAGSHAPIVAAFGELTQFMRQHIPAHWGMSKWGFRPLLSEQSVRWSSNEGRGKKGYTFSSSPASLGLHIGALLGYFYASQNERPDSVARLQSLGLSSKKISTFLFIPSYTRQKESKGHTPEDAYALMAVQSSIFCNQGGISSKPVQSPLELLRSGINQSRNSMKADRKWSASPTLWGKVRKKRLMRQLIDIWILQRTYLEFSQRVQNIEEYDRNLANCVTLMNTIKVKADTPKQVFLIHMPNEQFAGAPAWCGSSAILCQAIHLLNDLKLPGDVENWSVYSLADELGQNARDIFRQA